MKIIFMGTPEIAVPCLKILCENGFEIPFVVTQPDKPKGRGNIMQPTPVKEYAQSVGLTVLQPEKIKGNDEIFNSLKNAKADFFVVAAYGRILPQNILDLPLKAPVNVHFSLLPKYRGAAPVNWAIINGDEATGVSTMLMDAGMDTGDVLLKKECLIEKKNAQTLSEELAVAGAELLIKTLNNFDIITPLKQNNALATPAPIMKKEDGLINWNETAEEIERKSRGFFPWPTAYSHQDGKTVKFFTAEVTDIKSKTTGIVIDVQKDSFVISTGSSGLRIIELQIEGKKRMDAASFLAGNKILLGTKFE